MANESRSAQLSVISLIDKVRSQPYKFSFEKCVFILGAKHKSSLGSESSIGNAPVKIASPHRLYLAGCEVANISSEKNVDVIYADRMSLTSLNSPLPNVYIEKIKLAEWKKNRAMPDFFNIFTHRLAGISYKISARKHHALQTEKGSDTQLGKCMAAMMGDDIDIPLCSAHLLWMRPKSLLGLRILISSFFEVDVEIEQLVGCFTKISPTYLKISNSHLGETAVLGERFFDYAFEIKITIKQLDSNKFEFMKKGTDGYKMLVSLIEKYLPSTISYQLEIIPSIPWKVPLNKAKVGINSWV